MDTQLLFLRCNCLPYNFLDFRSCPVSGLKVASELRLSAVQVHQNSTRVSLRGHERPASVDGQKSIKSGVLQDRLRPYNG
jgi:hypothetical protein